MKVGFIQMTIQSYILVNGHQVEHFFNPLILVLNTLKTASAVWPSHRFNIFSQHILSVSHKK